MKRLRYYFTVLMMMFVVQLVSAQPMQTGKEDPSDFMNGSGKIYVVLAVVVVIVAGLLLYVINLDKKISKLEKEMK